MGEFMNEDRLGRLYAELRSEYATARDMMFAYQDTGLEFSKLLEFLGGNKPIPAERIRNAKQNFTQSIDAHKGYIASSIALRTLTRIYIDCFGTSPLDEDSRNQALANKLEEGEKMAFQHIIELSLYISSLERLSSF